MSTSNQKFNEFVPSQAGPSSSNNDDLPPPPMPPPPPSADEDGAVNIDLEAPPEEKGYRFKDADEIIARQIEASDELPSYAELVSSGQVKNPQDPLVNLASLNVDIQLAKFAGQIAIKQFNAYKEKNINIPLGTFVEQTVSMMKILAVVRVLITDLRLSEDTYLYIQTACEYLGIQMLVRYAILKKNPLYFRDDEGVWKAIRLVQNSYLKLWLKFAQMLTNPDFRKLTPEAQAAKIDVPNGEYHLLLFKLIDPDYSYHAGRRISRFVDKMFGTPKKKECTSGLCNLSPEAMKAVKYHCTCEVSKYQKKKAERAAGQQAQVPFTVDPPAVHYDTGSVNLS